MAERKYKNEADRILSLQREDPIQFWLRRAHESAPRLRLPVEFLGEAIGILTGAVSEQWVREGVAKRRPGFIGVFHGNPLIKALAVAGDNDLVTVVELAIYLKHLVRVEGLQEVITSLRGEDTFDSALLQLAYAYRFQKMGVQVRLEPAAARGRRGDIHLAWRGKEYMVECHAPRPKPDPLKDVMAFSFDRITKAASDTGKVVRVLIRFLSYPDDQQRLEMEKAAARLIRDVPLGRVGNPPDPLRRH